MLAGATSVRPPVRPPCYPVRPRCVPPPYTPSAWHARTHLARCFACHAPAENNLSMRARMGRAGIKTYREGGTVVYRKPALGPLGDSLDDLGGCL
jgi:hypothetical protein